MRISITDPRPNRLFDCSTEAGHRLMRCLGAAAVLALGAGLLFSGLATDVAWGGEMPAAPSLRSVVAVRSDVVTIGDFFEDAGAQATTALFRAPDLGTTGTVPARRVVELARAAGFTEAETGGLAEVTVSRLARPVEADELARVVAAAVLHQPGRTADDLAVDDLRVVFDGTVDPRQADLRSAVPVRVASLSTNPQTGRFDALVLIDKGDQVERLHLRGEVVETAAVVTLTRPINRGETVGRDDVQIERLPRRTTGVRRSMDPSEIVGMAARRQLRPGQPVAAADFVRPNVVTRGDMVTIVYETQALIVTSRGQSQDAGAVGDLVTVINPQSKRSIHATVTGPGRVSVGAPAAAVAALAKVNP
ncbi:flagellar basal body P-ring formation protein FlgA [Siculibacillus lacustris]|uniref:Flagellar basal body P-ring formation protein FlgA n=1 Tax=Siculibacillus lacustris TaxID=1549641 RepID=A0A4V2KSM5_9HYPH|nr:flagellar basal body P-ring formation chaperone FlgA [Siculibacillus lacustris]TBW33493.1 flagellar basal body P-ring formation protein FlgA [Siculibacillus lacustris]